MSVQVDAPRTAPTSVLAPTTESAAARARRHPTRSHLGRTLVLTDLVGSGVAWGLAGPIVLTGPTSSVVAVIVLATTLTPLSMAGFGLYRSVVCVSRLVEVTRTTIAGMSTVALLYVLERAGAVQVDGVEAGWTGAASIVFLLIGRSGFRAWVRAKRAAGHHHRPIVAIGRGAEVRELLTFYAEHPEAGYDVVGVISDEPLGLPPDAVWLGNLDDDAAIVAVGAVGGAVLSVAGLSSATSNRLLRCLVAEGVLVHLHTGLTRIDHRRLRALPLVHEPLHYLAAGPSPRLRLFAKRSLDVVGASIALVLSTPVLLAAGTLIHLSDGGPAVFRQQRIGAGGARFTMLKLRTMVLDAESIRDQLLEQNVRSGPLFKADVDPRITPVGRWLRALSIDEIPQLFNVLRGEMSLVGPRPALPTEIAEFDEELRDRRHDVRPGMTGLWQVEARDNPSIYVYRRLDLFYVDNWTLAGDVSILARTAGAVVLRGSQRILRGERR